VAADSILKDALALPVSERARLVRVLSESIEQAREDLSDADWLDAWGPSDATPSRNAEGSPQAYYVESVL
jgi:acyl-CoA reductase-like NAD-dependent aldehyde dehydrogenase